METISTSSRRPWASGPTSRLQQVVGGVFALVGEQFTEVRGELGLGGDGPAERVGVGGGLHHGRLVGDLGPEARAIFLRNAEQVTDDAHGKALREAGHEVGAGPLGETIEQIIHPGRDHAAAGSRCGGG